MRAKRIRVISVNDPAIDTERMTAAEMRKYIETRDESLILPFIKPGSSPTWFHLDEVSHALWEPYVEATTYEAERNKRALLASLRLVENLSQEDGVFLPSWEPPRFAIAGTAGVAHEECLQRFSPSERAELGEVAYAHGFFPRRTPVLFPLPPTCRAQLATRTFRPADANRSLEAQSSGGQSPSSADPQSPQPEIATQPAS